MKRGEFIRLSILGAIGVAVAPALDLAPKLPALQQTQWVWLKVTRELVERKELWNPMLADLIKQNKLEDKGNLTGVEVGTMDDDFVKNLATVVLTFN